MPNQYTLNTRFWLKVNKNGSVPQHCPELGACWEWAAALYENGYGSFWDGSKKIAAHRFSWIATNGAIPAGFKICHKCDNPKCVNPDHLFIGTQKDNIEDMIKKGRKCVTPIPGEAHGMHKLTAVDVQYIRSRYAQGNISMSVLGKEMGISRSHIGAIINRRNWKHLL